MTDDTPKQQEVQAQGNKNATLNVTNLFYAITPIPSILVCNLDVDSNEASGV